MQRVAISDEGLDALLSAAAERTVGEPSEVPGLDTAEVVAFRRGELPEDSDAEVAARLARDPEQRALLAQLANEPPESALAWAEAQLPGDARPQRRWAYAGALALVASLVCVFVAYQGARSPWHFRYEWGGGVAAERGPVFDQNSRVKLHLEAEGVEEGSEPGLLPELAVFVDTPGSGLKRVDAGRLIARSAGVYLFDAPARPIFGTAPGERSLYVVWGEDPAELSALEGLPPDEALARYPELGWLTLGTEYRPKAEAPPP